MQRQKLIQAQVPKAQADQLQPAVANATQQAAATTQQAAASTQQSAAPTQQTAVSHQQTTASPGQVTSPTKPAVTLAQPPAISTRPAATTYLLPVAPPQQPASVRPQGAWYLTPYVVYPEILQSPSYQYQLAAAPYQQSLYAAPYHSANSLLQHRACFPQYERPAALDGHKQLYAMPYDQDRLLPAYHVFGTYSGNPSVRR